DQFRVPAGVRALDVRAWGQGGEGSSLAHGGAGAHVAGTLAVTPGERLRITVAGQGFADAPGGEGGARSAGDGGGSTTVRSSDGTALLVAG
ncbi:hypothetical protein G3I20_05970, partial [Streptomyces sp. SID8111]|nr:hypothetical protein [Streptomyces sp. SID8111]